MSFKPGSVVGDYTVLEAIGTGGMGTVYKVQHVITKRVEAMKLLASGRTEPEQEQRFVREMQVQARLHHPNIAGVYNAFRFYDEFFMVMEFIEGESLESLVRKKRLPLNTAIKFARQALSALNYAHGYGIVHRDIAPANMIITPDETVKLTDFGLAKTTGDIRLTHSGAPVGSPWYMSPEQVRGGSTLDARSDIYSLGAVLYEMVTGRKVFDLETAFDVMRAQVELTPLAPADSETNLPAGLSEIMMTALAKDPEARFQTAEQFRGMLEPFEYPLPAAAPAAPVESRPVVSATPTPAPIARRPQPKPLVRVAQAAVGSAAVVLSLFVGYSTYSGLRATTTKVELPPLFPPKPLIPSPPDFVPPREVAQAPAPKLRPVRRQPAARPLLVRTLPTFTPAQSLVEPAVRSDRPRLDLGQPPTLPAAPAQARNIPAPWVSAAAPGEVFASRELVGEPETIALPPAADSGQKDKKEHNRLWKTLSKVVPFRKSSAASAAAPATADPNSH